MAETFLKLLVDNLTSLIQKEIGMIMGVDNEMKKLQNTLTTLQSVLEDAEAKQLHSKPIQNWLTNLNNAAFEIEDILDECATEVSKLAAKSRKFNLKRILFSMKIGRRMKQMSEILERLAAERHNFHLREIVVPQSREVDCRRETGSILIEPDHVYGREEDKEKIVDVLVNRVSDSDHLSVIPIIGVGGLGKTTLAQLVFNDRRVRQHFDTKLWICVSDNFDLKILLEAMIESLTGTASNLVHLDALQRRVTELLDQKKYLLILDDVWNESQEDWMKLKSILLCGSKGASIIVTTRQRKVADIMRTLPPHTLKGLSDEDLWSLFKLRALGRETELQPELEAIGRQIVKKCGGVPLAAKALGGLLRFKRKEKEWIHIRESEIWDLPEEEAVIMPALRLSYHHLPLELRRCFAFCAVFPKDYEMEKQDLIFHWIAHGCISSDGVQEVEDIGDQIWNELVLRSLFQEDSAQGIGTTAKMHDLVHDLAQSIMENKVPGGSGKKGNAGNNKVRMIHFSRNCWESCSSISLQVSTLTPIMNYTRLRTLKLNWARVENLPSAVGKLKHLRYLDLTNSNIRRLPCTFCNLWNLQIVILTDCVHLESLPKQIRYMTNLRHILLDGCSMLSDTPSRIGELTCLKTLSLFVVGHKASNQLDQLQHLNLGGRLEIRHLERTKSHVYPKRGNLVGKPNLVHLVLSWGGEESWKANDEEVVEALEPHPHLESLEINWFKGRRTPLWMTRMRNLSDVSLEYCRNISHLALGHLPGLKSLYIWSNDALEYIVSEKNEESVIFPSLQKLRLAHMANLKGVVNEEVVLSGTMFPKLEELYVKECEGLVKLEPRLPSLQSLRLWKIPGLTSVPEWLGEVGVRELVIRHCPQLKALPSTMWSLTSLAIIDCPPLQARCVEDRGEDWHKIAHIPHLLIR